MPYFNRFDVCLAYMTYMNLYHRGQWSKEYAMSGALARIKYFPHSSYTESQIDCPPEERDEEWENAGMIFDILVATKGRNIRDRR